MDPLPVSFSYNVLLTVCRYEHTCDLLMTRKVALLKVISATSSPMPGGRGAKGKKSKDKDKVCTHSL